MDQTLKLDQDQGRGLDTESRVRLKARGKIYANFNLLKRGPNNTQLIHTMFGISSVNVNGLNDPNKRNTIFTHFKNSGDDIFFLQNLRADSKNKLDKWLHKWDGPSYSAGKDKSSSIAILFMKNTNFEVNKISEDANGRFLLVNGTKDYKNVTLCNIYAPSGPQNFKERKLLIISKTPHRSEHE